MNRLYNSGLHFNLKCNEETGILAVYKGISADRNLHFVYHIMVQLYYFRNGFDMRITVPLLNLIYLKILSPV